MQIHELQAVKVLADLPIVSLDHPSAIAVRNPERLLKIAEACDMLQLFELLHRGEYEPVVAVQFGKDGDDGSLRVYFTRRESVAEDPACETLVSAGRD